MKKCVIIGSGLGGLSTGVILAKNGYEVTILEQSNQFGGCLQCFQRDGVKFETGMHFVGSMDDGQVLSNYFNYLEIKDKIVLNRMNPEGYEEILLQDKRYVHPNGREAFINHYSQQFPLQRDNLERYFDLVEQVASLSPFRSLNAENAEGFFNNDLFFKSINEVIDETITDPVLREVLVGNLSLYAAERDKTPFSTHAFIFDFYNKSAFRIVGGSERVAIAMAEVLQSYGGQILTRKKVTKILIGEIGATGVMTEQGETFSADVVISDVHPKQLIELVGNQVFTKAFMSRIASLSDTSPVFSLYLRFKEGMVPYLNSNFYRIHSDSAWDMKGTLDENWPYGYFYMHHCHEPNPQFAKGGVILSYLSSDAMKPWENTTIGHRGADYEAFKRDLAERLLDDMEKDFPNLRNCISSYYTATPLTYRDYTLTPNGSMYGLAKDVQMGIAARVSFKTKVPNLFLVGQNINAHGMLGVLVGTMKVCAHLVGETELARQVKAANRKTVLIMGGGLGGLVTGALLAKENYKVTVLEKNHIVGGGLQSFKRHGLGFPTGMHVFGGFQTDGRLRKLFNYLGIMDKLSIKQMDEDANDVVMVGSDHAEYRFPRGFDRFVGYLASQFPEEADHIKAYMEKLKHLSEEDKLFYLQENESSQQHSDDFVMAFDSLMDRYIQNPKLKALLHYLTPLFNGIDGETPACLNALISMVHLEGTCQFVGDSQQMADALVQVIEDAGGKVLTGKEVTEIKVTDHEVKEVFTRDGSVFHADNYISDLHPKLMLDIIGKGAFTKAYIDRVQDIKETRSCFKVFLVFKEQAFPYLNHTTLYLKDYDSWKDLKQSKHEDWPQGMMFFTPPKENQGLYANTMVVNCIMDYAQVKRWENTTVGHRGEEYEKWKAAHIDQVLNMLETLYPHFRQGIKEVFASSPLTIRDYYGNPEGSLYGFHRDCNQLLLSQLSVFTKVKNLFLTGQNINFHGMYGVSMTAIETTEALVGKNVIVKKINEKTSDNT